MTALRSLGLMLLALTLSACGFHLRGSYDIPPELLQLNLRVNPASNLSAPLSNALQTAGVQLGSGRYSLIVTREKLNKQTTNTDSRAKVAEYTLIYDLSYHITDADGEKVGDEQKLTLRRSYQYDTTTIVGKSEEEETLIRELYTDAAHQILRQISFFRPVGQTSAAP